VEVAVFKKWTILLVITALFIAGSMEGTAIAGQNAPSPKAQDKNNVALGETDTKQLLLLMNQDKDGKVSKQEFMRFMEAEFDKLDKKKEGKLDVKELTQPPTRSFHK
jgi:sulfatase maturation enzyme AslB (radical SAM superfamily)